MQKTSMVHDELHVWDQETLKGPMRRMKKLKRELEQKRRGLMTDENLAAQKELLVRIELLMEQEELIWVQRARANWLKHGDRNTSFFQRYASMRRRRNKIKGLIDDHGVKQENNGVMCAMVKNYFAHLFTRENGEIDNSVLESVPRKVTDGMNEELLLPFTEQEVKEALFNIGDLKARGPDGLHAIFYKRFWSMLGDDLVTEVLQAVNSCTIPSGWNNTIVVLIPKVENPETVA